MTEEDINSLPDDGEFAPPKMASIVKQANDVGNHALSQLINLSESKVFHEPTCPICNSAARTDLEIQWAKDSTNIDAIIELAKTKSALKISKSVIHNHMRHHSDAGVRELQKIEYVDKLSRLSHSGQSTLQTINNSIAALNERIIAINSIVPNAEASESEIEKIKTDGTCKIIGQITSLMKLQAKIMEEIKDNVDETISLPSELFIGVFNDAMKNAKSDEQKEVIQNILQKLATIQV
jgi:hypothetical protein